MDQPTRAALAEALGRAMQAETDGHHFYLMAARSTPDPKGQAVFEQLAREELDHFHFLRAQRQAVLATGALDPGARLAPMTALEGPSPIFSDGFRARLKEAHFEMTALSVALQLEQNAFRFYDEQARAADQPEIQALFQRLADWERRHHAALTAQHDAFKEDYWRESGFSPF
jgi:rubrerythrin